MLLEASKKLTILRTMKLIIVFLACLFLCAAPARAADVTYSTVIEDLPLMSGMIEKTDEAVIFDKPAGRIVETNVETNASIGEVSQFYSETLPSLGWARTNVGSFIRGDETLIVRIEKTSTKTIVHFSLAPR